MLDIGGTTTDVGVLQGGFPRPASSEAVLAGVRINQRVPDIISIGSSIYYNYHCQDLSTFSSSVTSVYGHAAIQ